MRLKKKKNSRGSVMMEYIILNFGFFVILAVGGYFFVNPDAIGETAYEIDPQTLEWREKTDRIPRYGFLGNAFLQSYRFMLDVVSMPYP